MKKGIFKLMFTICSIIVFNTASAQMSDTVANVCTKHLENKFISDGQQYRSLLMNGDETAEFHTVLYGGTVYRIAACTGLSDGNLVFSVYDTERHLLFTNHDFKNAPYWDFKLNSTLNCTIEAQLNATGGTSGCAVLLVGFKQK